MRGFYIGRFQPYHSGHHAMVEHIAGEVDELIMGIGSAGDSHTAHDPFTAGERVLMCTKALREFERTDGLETYVVPIEDLNRNSVWVSHVQSMSPSFEVAYSNNPLVIRLFEEAGIEVRQSRMFDRERLEGSDIRQRIVDGDQWRTSVPDPVVEVIEEVNGVQRLRTVAESDVVERWEAAERRMDEDDGQADDEGTTDDEGRGGDDVTADGTTGDGTTSDGTTGDRAASDDSKVE